MVGGGRFQSILTYSRIVERFKNVSGDNVKYRFQPFSFKIIYFKRENIEISIISLVSDYQLSRKKIQKLKNFIAFKKLSKNKIFGPKIFKRFQKFSKFYFKKLTKIK